jgi:hypothetical protein
MGAQVQIHPLAAIILQPVSAVNVDELESNISFKIPHATDDNHSGGNWVKLWLEAT